MNNNTVIKTTRKITIRLSPLKYVYIFLYSVNEAKYTADRFQSTLDS